MSKRYRFTTAGTVHGMVAFLVILVPVLLQGCTGGAEGNPDLNSEHVTPTVEAVQARYGALPLIERLTGVVKAKNQIEIFPQISAAITDVYVRNGELVAKGKQLIRLRDKEFQERLKQARANYQISVAQAKQADAKFTEASTELKRTSALAEKDLASRAELEAAQTKAVSAEADLDLAKARVEQAQATIDEREEALSETIIRAPVSGTVGDRNAEVGMLVNPGTRLFTLGQLDNMKIEIVLTDRMLQYIELGQRAEIYTENPASGALSASLTRISPFLHPVTHSTIAEIDVDNSDGRLIPGMFVTVDVHYGESEQATIVPLSALYENPVTGVTGVYITQDSISTNTGSETGFTEKDALSNPISFRFTPVKVVAEGRMSAGIGGAEPDDWVVTLGQNLIGGDSGYARVHTVLWDWVEQLQNLQRQDLLREIMKRQQGEVNDTIFKGGK